MHAIGIDQKSEIDMPVNTDKPGLMRLAACKCPRCRRGDMFVVKNPWKLKSTMKMHDTCPVCTQPLNIEVGFYYGSSYVSYGLTVAISIITFIGWWLLVGISVDDNRVLYWLPFNAVLLLILQPYLMRLGRVGWLAFFVRYDKQWKTRPPKRYERINKELENSW